MQYYSDTICSFFTQSEDDSKVLKFTGSRNFNLIKQKRRKCDVFPSICGRTSGFTTAILSLPLFLLFFSVWKKAGFWENPRLSPPPPAVTSGLVKLVGARCCLHVTLENVKTLTFFKLIFLFAPFTLQNLYLIIQTVKTSSCLCFMCKFKLDNYTDSPFWAALV